MNLQTKIGPLRLRNPLIMASGTFGYGWEFRDFLDYSSIGGVVAKTVTLHPRKGNPPPRTCETACGVLNSIGLPNGGLEEFLEVGLPYLAKLPTCRIASIAGETPGEFARLASRISEAAGIDAIEVNVSCPNVEKGGVAFGCDPLMVGVITAKVKEATRLPVIVKLTPNVTSIAEIAVAAQEAGADVISAINTIFGMAVDWRRAQPALANVTGGLSGPAIKPIALKMVWDIVKAVTVPVIGVGGIVTGSDVLEFLTVGARAVEVGTVNLVQPDSCLRILGEVERLLAEGGFDGVEAVIGRFPAAGPRNAVPPVA